MWALQQREEARRLEVAAVDGHEPAVAVEEG
jgi:hypothetical protein